MASAVPDRIIEYKQVAGKALTLSVFEPEGHKKEDSAPAIVFFFGGGWKFKTPEHFYQQSRYLASRGMVAICPDYRVESRDGTSPKECVKDAKSAMRWVRSHAAALGIDPDRITAGGGSAGGHVAAAAAVLSGLNEKSDDLDVSCVPDALVLFNPVFDNGPNGYGYDRVQKYWEDFSPLHNLNSNVPPTLVLLGTKDKYVPMKAARSYCEQMDQLGVRCDLRLYDGQPHGFFNQEPYYSETIKEMDAFLVSLGLLAPINWDDLTH